jgi:hypothetical protein
LGFGGEFREELGISEPLSFDFREKSSLITGILLG